MEQKTGMPSILGWIAIVVLTFLIGSGIYVKTSMSDAAFWLSMLAGLVIAFFVWGASVAAMERQESAVEQRDFYRRQNAAFRESEGSGQHTARREEEHRIAAPEWMRQASSPQPRAGSQKPAAARPEKQFCTSCGAPSTTTTTCELRPAFAWGED